MNADTPLWRRLGYSLLLPPAAALCFAVTAVVCLLAWPIMTCMVLANQQQSDVPDDGSTEGHE